MLKKLNVLLILLVLLTHSAFAQWTSSRPDGHAPLGVMGDHTHEAGEFMLSYRFMSMQMKGSRDGSDSIEDADIVAAGGSYGYMVTPTEMPMQMHMFGLMYAPTDALTLMAMVPVSSLSMDHLMRNGNEFTTESSGVGDASLTGLILISNAGNSRVHLHAGVSLPTGSVDEKDVTPMSAPGEAPLPYPMQVGSGTFDLLPGLTYLGQNGDWSWGAQTRATIRLGENDNGYRFGHRYMGTAWGARRLSHAIGLSFRLVATRWEDVEGADSRLNPAMVATADPTLRAGSSMSAGAGFNYYQTQGGLKGFRLAAEVLVPVRQSLDGPQLETDLQVIAGAQYAF